MNLTLTHDQVLAGSALPGESPPAERPMERPQAVRDQRSEAVPPDMAALDVAALYDQYFTPVYNYLRYRVQDARTADDLTAQVFERVVQHRHRYQPARASFQTWLFAIARHIVSDHYRAQRRLWRWLPLPLDDLRHQPTNSPDLEKTIITHEANARLLEAVARLGAREREIIALRFGAELSHREIAALTSLTENNISVILHRALRRLRRELEGVIDYDHE